jgi:hypothetical protein
MRGEHVDPMDLIQLTPAGKAATDGFWRDCVYLTRYRTLINLFARAVLTPLQPLPGCMESLDDPGGQGPAERGKAPGYDVTRAHAVLLWAHAGRDPDRLADFLDERLFGSEANHFPKDVVLQAELTFLARKAEAEIVTSLAGRIAKERASSAEPADFEREFSPHATYLDPATATAVGHLLHSFRAFHEAPASVIREAAYAVVLKEIGR